MVPEAPLEQTEAGLVPKGDGWFVLNAREARWYHTEGRSAFCDFEGDIDFAQIGINVSVLQPGESPEAKHIIVGAGDGPCVALAVGSRAHADEAGWGGYIVDETAARHGVSVKEETTDAKEAYAGLTRRQPTRHRSEWLG